MKVLLLISAIIPVLVFLFFIYKKDSQKEPHELLGNCFLFGVASVIPILLIEYVFDYFNNLINSPFWYSFFRAFIVAALVEEGCKLFFLYRATWRNKEFDQSFDGIVYAVFVSLGFAMVENILYVLEHGFIVSISRALLSVPAHGLLGVMMGYFYALAKFSKNQRKQYLFLSFFIPFVFHGVFNFLLMYADKIRNVANVFYVLLIYLLFIVFDVFIWRMGIKSIKRHYAKDIREIEQDENVIV
ncbi:MAG: PrsW family glutamic-type intramembrane protease [Petrimonas sp.]|jgi:RsiW-degrading membrane proteinase PrsW (M82 family)